MCHCKGKEVALEETRIVFNSFTSYVLFMILGSQIEINNKITTQIPEMLGCFLNLNKMKTKRLSNHMSQYFIHNRT